MLKRRRKEGKKEEKRKEKKRAHIDSIEEHVSFLLWVLLLTVLEDFEVLEDLGVNNDFVEVSHRVLSQEIELDGGGFNELDVLHSQRAATNGVGLFIGVLFVACTQRQLVDQVQRCSHLSHHRSLIDEICGVNLPDFGNVFLEDGGKFFFKEKNNSKEKRVKESKNKP